MNKTGLCQTILDGLKAQLYESLAAVNRDDANLEQLKHRAWLREQIAELEEKRREAHEH